MRDREKSIENCCGNYFLQSSLLPSGDKIYRETETWSSSSSPQCHELTLRRKIIQKKYSRTENQNERRMEETDWWWLEDERWKIQSVLDHFLLISVHCPQIMFPLSVLPPPAVLIINKPTLSLQSSSDNTDSDNIIFWKKVSWCQN